MKKIIKLGVCLLTLALLVTGCGKKEEETKKESAGGPLDLTVYEILDRIYDGVDENDMPGLGRVEIDSENMAYYLGVDNLDIVSAVASEPLMGSNAWSVVVVEVNDGVDVEAAKRDIAEKVDPRKWICVDAEIVVTESRGNKIILIMMDELNQAVADKVQENFKNL